MKVLESEENLLRLQIQADKEKEARDKAREEREKEKEERDRVRRREEDERDRAKRREEEEREKVYQMTPEYYNENFRSLEKDDKITFLDYAYKVPVKILRDTGSNHSVIIRGAHPQLEKNLTGDSVILKGIGGEEVTPICRLHLSCELVTGNIDFALKDSSMRKAEHRSEETEDLPVQEGSLNLEELFQEGEVSPNVSTEEILAEEENSIVGEETPSSQNVPEGSSESTEVTDIESSTFEVSQVTTENLVELQKKDTTLAELFFRVVEPEEVQQTPTHLRDGLLMRKHRPVDIPGNAEWGEYHQILIPYSLRKQVVALAHKAGHMGIKKTVEKTLDFIETSNRDASATVTLLPPESGDQDIPSDEEQWDEQDNQLFEPAGEMKDKNDSSFDVSMGELKNFIGILERDYWSNQPDLKVPFVSETMSRDRFLKIKQYFHVADNQNLEGNKNWPGNSPDISPTENLWPLMKAELRKKNITSEPHLEEELSLDFIETSNRDASATVTLLPPESGDQDIPSDEEQWDEQDNQLFEPAGEMEVILDSSDSENEDDDGI
ncbi:uncharacterized protein [Macrobrachium rosenbergii]|uniref:uncharacterized protein n=1 Tax=Macrobrachium rosenbergii TaxID=79674 RepID=UPI0034D57BF3